MSSRPVPVARKSTKSEYIETVGLFIIYHHPERYSTHISLRNPYSETPRDKRDQILAIKMNKG